MSDKFTLGECLKQGVVRLQDTSSSVNLDCQILMSFVLGISRAAVLTERSLAVGNKEKDIFFSLVERRALHEPVAYLTREKEFFGLPFFVNEHVLVPRPETEYLVERALKFLETKAAPLSMLDLGTGSGCIAVTVAKILEKKSLNITAIDVSRDALDVARKNAHDHGVDITFVDGSWFEPLSPSAPFDLIISNPPYIAEYDPIDKELRHEPRQALFADEKGLAEILKILNGARRFLKGDGLLLIECGSHKDDLLNQLIHDQKKFWSITLAGDLETKDGWRCICASPADT